MKYHHHYGNSQRRLTCDVARVRLAPRTKEMAFRKIRSRAYLKKCFAAAEAISYWFWFNDNKERVIVWSFFTGEAGLVFAARCQTQVHQPWHTSRFRFSRYRKKRKFSLPLSSNFQSAALVYALFVFLACFTRIVLNCCFDARERKISRIERSEAAKIAIN